MKFWMVMVMLMVIISLANAQAQEWECSNKIAADAASVKVINFLKKYEGRSKLGSCRVEIQVCKFENGAENTGTLGADLLITDVAGFQRYVPIFLNEESERWAKQVSYVGARALVYRFKDKTEDPLTGSDENYDIEFVRKENSEELDYIEVGYTGKNERADRVNKNWIACGEEREEYLKNHPTKHKFKSLWWWLKNPGKR